MIYIRGNHIICQINHWKSSKKRELLLELLEEKVNEWIKEKQELTCILFF